MAAHYLFDPVACTPAAGWEKGQVENQVGLARTRCFARRRRFEDVTDLNEFLVSECLAWAKTQPHLSAAGLMCTTRERLMCTTWPSGV